MHYFDTIIRFVVGVLTFSFWFWQFLGTYGREMYFISVDSTTSNEKYLSANLNLQFIRRGCQGASGYIYLNQLILDDNSVVEGHLGYNSQNSNNFTPTPFGLQSQNLLNFFNDFYRSYIMSPFANCSDLPQKETNWQSLDGFGKNYTLNKCVLDMNLLPALNLGYHSATLILIRSEPQKVEFDLTIVFKIE